MARIEVTTGPVLITDDGAHIVLNTNGREYCTGPGYCRKVNDKPCGCTNAWVLPDGTCPCAPGDTSNPIIRQPSPA